MKLSEPRLYILGPANGSVGFELPGGRRSNDDTLFVPSSTFLLRPSAFLVRLVRMRAPGGWRSRYCLYRQVYEPGMSRLGHALGAVFEFAESAPPALIVFETLWKLVDFLKSRCTLDNQFCELKQFKEFVELEVSEDFSLILDDLRAGISAPIFEPIDQSVLGRYFIEVDALTVERVSEIADQIFTSPLGAGIEEMVLAAPTAGDPGTDIRQIVSLTEPFMETGEALHKALTAAKEHALLRSEQYSSLLRDFQNVSRSNQELQTRAASLAQHAATLEKQLNGHIELNRSLRLQLEQFRFQSDLPTQFQSDTIADVIASSYPPAGRAGPVQNSLAEDERPKRISPPPANIVRHQPDGARYPRERSSTSKKVDGEQTRLITIVIITVAIVFVIVFAAVITYYLLQSS